MSKKKKVSEFKKDRIKQILTEIDTERIYDKNFFQVDNLLKYLIYEDNNLKNFRNIGSFEFFNVKENKTEKLVIACLIPVSAEKKDSIENNKLILNVVDFLEKIFIYLDSVKVERYNDFKSNLYYILIKSEKNDSLESIIKNI